MKRDDRKEKRRFRPPTPIQVTGALFAVLFAAMIVYLCSYAYNNRQVMMSNSYNGRQKILLAQNSRGSIYARDGEVLADSVLDADGNETRRYPFGNLFAHAVGYATKGKAGIEAQENYYLIRSDISLSEKARLSDEGAFKNPGNSVTTTLSVPLQEVAYKALGAYNGAAIVTDVRTGEILAMVSKPDFDPAQIDALWNDLINDKEDSRLLNRVTQGLYPPGSTFKIVTALEYIREHPTDHDKYRFTCSGSFKHDGEVIHCYHGTNHGALDFLTSFQMSCNSSFANIGLTLDRASYMRTLARLGFSMKFDVPFVSSVSRVGVTADSPDGDIMQAAIGQGAVAMSPLHLNMITQAVASGGMMRLPFLVSSVDSADGRNLVHVKEGGTYGRVMSEDEARILTQMMISVVNGGTGKRLEGLSYQAAGKTGSAEFDSTQKSESHAWFTGFAPAEDPQIAVTIIIEEAGSGGEYAVPIAKRIFDAWFGTE